MTTNSSEKKVIVIGAGGHARAISSLIKILGKKVDYYLDDDPDLQGKDVNGITVRGTTKDISNGETAFIGIGRNFIRKQKAEKHSGLTYPSFIHPDAIISPEVEIGTGTAIMAGAIIQPGSKIGNHVIVNSGVVIEHDCTLHDYSHIAPNATLAGSCTLQEGAFLGVNACMIEGKVLGAWSVVGAGACVITDIPEWCTAVGLPAKVIKKHE
ncbi:MAG: acetyltransferase [Balneolaceae bacterium]